MQAWNDFREDQGNAEALNILNRLNPANNGAPKIALSGMSLSGAFSKGAQDLLNRLAEIKFPTPLTGGSLSYLAARQRWMDWRMRIFQQNILNGVAKVIASGLRVFRAYIPTAMPMDYATEAVNIAPFTRHPQIPARIPARILARIPARIPALDSSDSASDAEPQFSEDEHSSSDDPGSALTIIVLSSGDDTVSGNDTYSSPHHNPAVSNPALPRP